MLQVVQNVRSGELEVKEVPPPALLPGGVLVRTAASVISPGTEKSGHGPCQKDLIGKAKERPDLVRRHRQARTQGVLNTFQAVMQKWINPRPATAPRGCEEAGAGVVDLKIATGCDRRQWLCESCRG
jgi:hypothetical protein